MIEGTNRRWQDFLNQPLSGRLAKPKNIGLTMVIDTGLGIRHTEDLLDLGEKYVDIVKLGFGTSYLYPDHLLRSKINLLRDRGVRVCPGGTFLEIAIVQNKWRDFLEQSFELGFDCIEVSDGTIHLDEDLRQLIVQEAVLRGFCVVTEVGKKEGGVYLPIEKQVQIIRNDLQAGAFKVIIEGRESGKSVGIYEKDGSLRHDDLYSLVHELGDINALIWEAPLKHQQEQFIVLYGPNVNLGNVYWTDVIALEALRTGLRGDTLRHALGNGFSGIGMPLR